MFISQFSHSVMSDSATPWTATRQASLSITTSRSLLKLMSIESVMPSSHLILCRLGPWFFVNKDRVGHENSRHSHSGHHFLNYRLPLYPDGTLQIMCFFVFYKLKVYGNPASSVSVPFFSNSILRLKFVHWIFFSSVQSLSCV